MIRHKVVLVPFPFDDLSTTKVRPAVCLTENGKVPDKLRELSMGKSMGLMGMVAMVVTQAKKALAAG